MMFSCHLVLYEFIGIVPVLFREKSYFVKFFIYCIDGYKLYISTCHILLFSSLLPLGIVTSIVLIGGEHHWQGVPT